MMHDPTVSADTSARWYAAAEHYGVLTPDPSETFWEGMFARIDSMDADLSVLDEHQAARLDGLRARVNALDARERAFVHGLMMECMCVATDHMGVSAQ